MKKLIVILALCVAAQAQILAPILFGKPVASGPGNFALVATSPATPGCSGSTTCAITLTSSLGANHLATLECYLTNPTYVASLSAGGTAVPVWSATGRGNANSLYPASAYIYPTSATAGPITLTFGANIGTGSTCVMREYSVSTGTPILDWAKQELKAATTTATGETPIFTGTKDLVVQANNTDYQYTTAVATYGDGKFDGFNGGAWADLLNTTSTTPPTWTITSGSGNAATNGMAFATNATACNDEVFSTFEGGTSGNNLAAATLAPSTFGGNGAWGTEGGSNIVSGALTYQSAAQMNLLNTFNSCDGHKTGSGSVGYKFNTALSTADYFPYVWGTSSASISNTVCAGYWFVPNIATSDTGYYAFNALTAQPAAADFASLMVHSGSIYIETSTNPNGVPDVGSFYSYTQGTQYWVTEQFQKYINASTYHTLNIYSSTGTLLSTQQKVASSTAGGQPQQFYLGRGGDSGTTSGSYVYMDNLKLDFSGSCPTP